MPLDLEPDMSGPDVSRTEGVYKTILVPLDGSEVAAAILDQVAALARTHQANLLLLTVGTPLPAEYAHPGYTPPVSTFQAEAYLRRLQKELEAQGLHVSVLTRIGEAVGEILETARRYAVDLIVINSRGGGGAPSLFLGSVADKVANASPVPVLMLRATPAAQESS
jgi:nucleotide-binding universal stress UspA family protein